MTSWLGLFYVSQPLHSPTQYSDFGVLVVVIIASRGVRTAYCLQDRLSGCRHSEGALELERVLEVRAALIEGNHTVLS